MGITSNLLYLLLLYAVLDKEGKLGTSTGLLLALGVMVGTNCLNNAGCCNTNNNCCCMRQYNGTNGYYSANNNFAFNNALF